jgi:uncharacterized phiE125 gp8 family phage protein
MGTRRLIPPTILAVSLADQKLFMRVDHALDDAMIETLIETATEEAEAYCRRSWLNQTLVLTLDAFPADAVELLYGLVDVVQSVVYKDGDGNAVTISPGDYFLDNSSVHGSGWVLPLFGTEWPATRSVANAVVITYSAGYSTPDQVPTAVRTWIKLRCGQIYDNRDGSDITRLNNIGLLDRWTLHQH